MKRTGIDIGGTFTDVVVYDEATRVLTRRKALSTPDAPEEGCLSAFKDAGLAPAEISHLIHGTTIVTNLIIERKGAKVGVIATEGFRDVLEIMRATRERPYDLHWKQPEPLVPRHLRLEVTERIGARGEVIVPLDEGSVRRAVTTLVNEGVDAIAVSLMHSYANTAHEDRVGAIIAEMAPGLPVSLSSKVCREIREYERASTTVVNAYAMPRVDAYVAKMDAGLPIERGIKYMSSEGGIVPSRDARRLPMTLALSGPAGGVLASLFLGEMTGLRDLITIDMGGTSLDISVIRNGAAQLTNTLYVQWGIPIRTPAIDVKTIGAGGGSIVWIDEGGAIRVGPHSAGAVPGPACYGRGGKDCTVTDANMILGILNPTSMLGGKLAVDPARSFEAVTPIAAHVGRDARETAEGIYRIVNANMAAAIRHVTVEKGIDPRGFALVSFGGAGGQHAVALAIEIGIPEVVIPNLPSVFSAFGMVSANMRHSRSRTLMAELNDATLAAMPPLYEALEADATKSLAAESAVTSIVVERAADLRYAKQAHEISIDIKPGDTAADVYARFEARHKELYGTALGHAASVVTLRTTVIGVVPPIALTRHVPQPQKGIRILRSANVYPNEGLVPVLDRTSLGAGVELPVPCLVEEVDSMHYIPPGCRARVDEWLNIRVSTKP
jgi:N-methylhydantoinase A